MFCTDVEEDFAERELGGCEKIYKGKNNSYIAFGRDRPAGITSGAGGKGATQAAMIDLVCGQNASHLSKEIKNNKKIKKGRTTYASPNFATDAARIYMSQKCIGQGGIDNYLGFTRTMSPTAENKSAIAIKADHVRIVGRENVRIYAARAEGFTGFDSRGEKTTLHGKIYKSTIELVAGREADLQPAVLGENLRKYLDKLVEWQTEILRVILSIIEQLLTQLFFLPYLPENIASYFTLIIETINRQINLINSHDALIISGGLPITSNNVFLT